MLMALMLPRKLQLINGFMVSRRKGRARRWPSHWKTNSIKKTRKKIQAIHNLVENDHRITINEVAKTLDISFGSVNSILHEDLGLSKLSVRWVPKELRRDQMILRTDLSLAILIKIEANEEAFMSRIITGGETWIHRKDPETKNQSKQWLPRRSSGPIKFKSERSVLKLMATIF